MVELGHKKKIGEKKDPGDNLLSHGETPHYHRRSFVSLLSSRWDQVGPNGYGRQEKRSRDAGCRFYLTTLLSLSSW